MDGEKLDVFEVMHTARAMRWLRPEPVPPELIRTILEAAIAAPNGGNRQTWGFIVVTDPTIKSEVQQYYAKAFEFVSQMYASSPPPPGMTPAQYERQHKGVQHLTEHYHEAPLWIVACIDHGGHPSAATGASLYPAVQNILLAARTRSDSVPPSRRATRCTPPKSTRFWGCPRTSPHSRSCRSASRIAVSVACGAARSKRSSIRTDGASRTPTDGDADARASARREHQRQRVDVSDRDVVVAGGRIGIERVVGDPLVQRGRARPGAPSRARCEPRHRWKPLANAMCRLVGRSKSTASGSSKALVVEVGGGPHDAQLVARVHLLTADLEVGGGVADHRRRPASGSASAPRSRPASSDGSSTTRWRSPGFRANQSTMHDSEAETVSSPASTSRNVMSMTSSRVSRSPSTSAVMNPPIRSSPGRRAPRGGRARRRGTRSSSALAEPGVLLVGRAG